MSILNQIIENPYKLGSFIEDIVKGDCDNCPAREYCAKFNLALTNECPETITEYLESEGYSYDSD